MEPKSATSLTSPSWVLAAVLCIAASYATPVSADEDGAEARAHFDAGRVAFESKDYAQALDEFRALYQIRPSPEILYNIGVSADLLDRDEEALAAFEEYLRLTRGSADEDEVRQRIEELRASIERKASLRRALEGSDASSRRSITYEPASASRSTDKRSGRKKWPWAVAAVVVVAAGVTTGLLVTRDARQDDTAPGALRVQW